MLMLCRLNLWAALLLTILTARVEAEIPTDFLMNTDPEFQSLDLIKVFHRDFKSLWLQALQRPEIDYQRKAAETVARAHEYGIPNLIELVPALETILTKPDTHPSARFAAARALIVLESRNSAPKLLDAGLNHGANLRQLVEPALAAWNFSPARDVWIKRLEAPRTTPQDLILALKGLANIRETTALSAISNIALDILKPSYIRLEAAGAAGEIVDAGLEMEAERLVRERRSRPLINRLCAVRLLARHSSEHTRQLLIELAGDKEPSLVAAALRRLNEIAPELVVPLAEQAMQNPDPHVREAGASAWILQPSPERMPGLVRMLDDDHPDIRKFVAEKICQLAESPQLEQVIRAEAMQVLAGDRWQGQVQATLVLGMLDHKPAADRFVELLEAERTDVMITAAWGLRKLAEPHTIPAILDRIQRQTTDWKIQVVPGVDEQVAHLFEACGKLEAMEAESLMRQYVPKDVTRTMDLSRSAAIWGLGRLHRGTPDADLATELVSRVRDSSDHPYESPLVKQMAVVALVRMNAVESSADIKSARAIHAPASALDLATCWAIRELTGETLPAPVPQRYPDGEWFLEPLDVSSASLP